MDDFRNFEAFDEKAEPEDGVLCRIDFTDWGASVRRVPPGGARFAPGRVEAELTVLDYGEGSLGFYDAEMCRVTLNSIGPLIELLERTRKEMLSRVIEDDSS